MTDGPWIYERVRGMLPSLEHAVWRCEAEAAARDGSTGLKDSPSPFAKEFETGPNPETMYFDRYPNSERESGDLQSSRYYPRPAKGLEEIHNMTMQPSFRPSAPGRS